MCWSPCLVERCRSRSCWAIAMKFSRRTKLIFCPFRTVSIILATLLLVSKINQSMLWLLLSFHCYFAYKVFPWQIRDLKLEVLSISHWLKPDLFCFFGYFLSQVYIDYEWFRSFECHMTILNVLLSFPLNLQKILTLGYAHWS